MLHRNIQYLLASLCTCWGGFETIRIYFDKAKLGRLPGEEVKNNLYAQLVALEFNERCDFGDVIAAFQYLNCYRNDRDF